MYTIEWYDPASGMRGCIAPLPLDAALVRLYDLLKHEYRAWLKEA
jgi:hypothetical protein